jgi:hypothetical protein
MTVNYTEEAPRRRRPVADRLCAEVATAAEARIAALVQQAVR